MLVEPSSHLGGEGAGAPCLADGGEALPEDDVAAIEAKVDGGVEHDEQGVEDDQVLGPRRELAEGATAVQDHRDHLVDGDDHLEVMDGRFAICQTSASFFYVLAFYTILF